MYIYMCNEVKLYVALPLKRYVDDYLTETPFHHSEGHILLCF